MGGREGAELAGAVGAGGDLLLPVVRDAAARTAASRTGSRAGSAPPASLASGFYPARGPYSSADALVRRRADARDRRGGHRDRDRLVVGARVARGQPAAAGDRGGAGARALGRGAPRAVRRPDGRVAPRRTSATSATLGITDFYVWASTALPDAEWAELNARLDRRAHVREHEPRGPRGRGRVRRALHLRRPALRRRALPAALRPGAAARAALRAVRRAGLRRPACHRRRRACGRGGTARPTTRCGAAR